MGSLPEPSPSSGGPLALPDLATGTVVGGRYTVRRQLGRGGMGAVYVAHDETLDREIALKICLAPDDEARFVNEARAVARIRSPHVVTVHDVGALPSGARFLVMELLEGEDLSQRLRRGRLSIGEAVDVTLQALDGVAAAHAHGIVHRDLKPANLFLSREPDGTQRVKVLDFGISKLRSLDGAPSLTTAKSLLGTPYYMAPEQLRNPKLAEARSDLWSIGVILYEMTIGQRPFEASTIGELLASVLETKRTHVRRAWPDAPTELDDVVARCLAPRPEDRFACAADLSRALAPLRSDTRARPSVPAAAATEPAWPSVSSLAGRAPTMRVESELASSAERVPPAMSATHSAPPAKTPWPRVAAAGAAIVAALALAAMIARGGQAPPTPPGAASGTSVPAPVVLAPSAAPPAPTATVVASSTAPAPTASASIVAVPAEPKPAKSPRRGAPGARTPSPAASGATTAPASSAPVGDHGAPVIDVP